MGALVSFYIRILLFICWVSFLPAIFVAERDFLILKGKFKDSATFCREKGFNLLDLHFFTMLERKLVFLQHVSIAADDLVMADKRTDGSVYLKNCEDRNKVLKTVYFLLLDFQFLRTLRSGTLFSERSLIDRVVDFRLFKALRETFPSDKELSSASAGEDFFVAEAAASGDLLPARISPADFVAAGGEEAFQTFFRENIYALYQKALVQTIYRYRIEECELLPQITASRIGEKEAVAKLFGTYSGPGDFVLGNEIEELSRRIILLDICYRLLHDELGAAMTSSAMTPVCLAAMQTKLVELRSMVVGVKEERKKHAELIVLIQLLSRR